MGAARDWEPVRRQDNSIVNTEVLRPVFLDYTEVERARCDRMPKVTAPFDPYITLDNH
jgi:hypothetical protein